MSASGSSSTSSSSSDGGAWSDLAEGVKDTLTSFGSNPVGFILGTVAAWIATEILEPSIESAVEIVGGVVDAILFVFLGSDKVLTYNYLDLVGSEQCGPGGCVSPGQMSFNTSVGAVEIPLYLADLLIEMVEPMVVQLLAGVRAFNAGIETTIAEAGLGAFPVATLLIGTELVVAGVALLYLAQSIAGAAGLAGVAASVRGVTSRLVGVIR